ncbi:MAG: ATP-binding cassette domain-containing protein [Patescibacteria group bacterium]
MNPFLGLVGPSGSGKSTLIKAMVAKYPEKLEISRSLTTRPRRGDEDDLFYTFTTPEDVRDRQARGLLTHFAEYAGNLYATDRNELDELLSHKIGIAALVEDGVRALRKAGYRVIVVKIQPEHYESSSDAERRQADQIRAQSGLKADHVVTNSFDPGGLERSLGELETILNGL